MKGEDLGIDMLLLSATLIWGLKPTMMKIGLKYMPPQDYNAARLIIASVTSWIFVLWSRKHKKISKRDITKILFISVCGFFIFQWFYTLGVSKTTAGNASVIMAAVPLIVAGINHLTGIENIRRNVYIGIGISSVGIIFVILGTGGFGLTPANIKGSLYMFASSTAYAIYTVFSRSLTGKYPARQITAYVITITTVISLLFSDFSISSYSITGSLVLSLLYTGVVAMYLGNYFWMIGIKKAGSSKVSMFNNLTPVFSIASAGIILKEGFTMVQFLGAAVILAGVYISRYGVPVLERKE